MKREQKESCRYSKIDQLAEVSLLEAFFVSFSYAPHAHDTFAVGQTLSGFQDFVCRGKKHRGFPGTLITINPDEVHDGHSGLETGFGYRMLYIPAATIFRSSAADMIKQGLVGDHGLDIDGEGVGDRKIVEFVYNVVSPASGILSSKKKPLRRGASCFYFKDSDKIFRNLAHPPVANKRPKPAITNIKDATIPCKTPYQNPGFL